MSDTSKSALQVVSLHNSAIFSDDGVKIFKDVLDKIK